MSAHTPTPWIALRDNEGLDDDKIQITTQQRVEESKVAIALVAVDFNEPFETEQQDNAAFIATAVNAHEALVNAVRQLLANSQMDGHSYRDCHQKAEALLATIASETVD